MEGIKGMICQLTVSKTFGVESMEKIATKLGIKIQAPFQNLSYHFVAPALSATGETFVFKQGKPGNPEMATEVAALQYYDGQGMVRLIESNVDEGWILLEACQPGVPVSKLDDDEVATHEALIVMKRLWKPASVNFNFPSIKDWLRALERMQADLRATPHISKYLMDTACGLAQDLISSMGEQVLLHGDLHHDNILSAQRESWLAIDPKGVIGEREYDLGALMRNPIQKLSGLSNLPRFLRRRLDQMAAETGFDRQRILQWSIVQAVLAAYWQIEDDCSEGQQWIHCAEALYESN